MQELRRKLGRLLVNLSGWQTKRRIVVIESDDWGSIRMPSKEVYEALQNKGIRVDISEYNRFDTLADSSDLERLFEVLSSVKDINGNSAIVTANTIVANPNFELIKKSGYLTYFYEPFTETLKREKRTENAFELWKEGISSRLFYPQFHGREHLNISRWIKDLENGVKETRIAFEYGFFGLSHLESQHIKNSYLAAMEYDTKEAQKDKFNIIETGLQLFNDLFGYKSKSYIATNYIWGDELNEILASHGVRYIQGMKKQGQPQIGHSPKYIRRILGETNHFGQTYLIRNCNFEPSQWPDINSVDSCLRDISIAFLLNKPAIISSHRLNFIGGIQLKNRETNLISFKVLLKEIVNKWPEVEFMSSDQLGDVITGMHIE